MHGVLANTQFMIVALQSKGQAFGKRLSLISTVGNRELQGRGEEVHNISSVRL